MSSLLALSPEPLQRTFVPNICNFSRLPRSSSYTLQPLHESFPPHKFPSMSSSDFCQEPPMLLFLWCPLFSPGTLTHLHPLHGAVPMLHHKTSSVTLYWARDPSLCKDLSACLRAVTSDLCQCLSSCWLSLHVC